MTRVRAAFRLARTALHVLGGALTVALVFPVCRNENRQRLKRRWSAHLVTILGVELRCSGVASASGLIVANHISFLDIYVINAIMPASFVSKDEVRKWPLIGWFAANTNTIFMARGSRSAAQRTRETCAEHLRQGKCVALFPEGTTSAGDTVLPFHSALLQAAIDTGADMIPLAIRYTDAKGNRSYATAYVGDMSLMQCLWNIACSPRIFVYVDILPAVTTEGIDRRHLSSHAHHMIAHRVSHPLMQGDTSRQQAQ